MFQKDPSAVIPICIFPDVEWNYVPVKNPGDIVFPLLTSVEWHSQIMY